MLLFGRAAIQLQALTNSPSAPGFSPSKPSRTAAQRQVLVQNWREKATAELENGTSTSTSSTNSRTVGTFAPPQRSSWDAKEAGGGRGQGADYLYELGKSQQYNINVTHGQNVAYIDSLFAGNILGHESDIADGSLRDYEFRKFNNIVGDYYVSPKFLDRVAMHIAKNYLMEKGCFASNFQLPLILGIWGEKGCGKTFQTELCLKQLGVETVVMSAGELEDEWAGTPGKLIRQRYRRAAEICKVHGKMTCLLMNDVDAGLGHFENVQLTVNNQIVVGTLMNLCDDPKHVSVGQDWRGDLDTIIRTPIILTGNDFSTMFAPLIRCGRMDKFYWKPDRDDLVNILFQLYKDDGLTRNDMIQLLKRFERQPLDFFGALRSAVYDDQIRDWIKEEITGADFTSDDANMSKLGNALLNKINVPKFEPLQLTLENLMEQGDRLSNEQDMVNQNKLSKEYLPNKPNRKRGRSLIGLQG